MPKVFISYSRKDMDFARKLADDLEKAGFDVWWDISDLKGGDDWVRTIPSAIEASQYFIILLSPDSVASQWVEREYLHALNLRLKVIPLLIRPCSVPFALANINYIDFTGPDPVASPTVYSRILITPASEYRRLHWRKNRCCRLHSININMPFGVAWC